MWILRSKKVSNGRELVQSEAKSYPGLPTWAILKIENRPNTMTVNI